MLKKMIVVLAFMASAAVADWPGNYPGGYKEAVIHYTDGTTGTVGILGEEDGRFIFVEFGEDPAELYEWSEEKQGYVGPWGNVLVFNKLMPPIWEVIERDNFGAYMGKGILV